MTEFSNAARLDPARMAAEFNEQAGSDVIDQWGILDPRRAVVQMAESAGIDPATITPDEILNVETSFFREVDEATGSPDWVPDDAKIHIDLINNRAWTETDGEVSIDTLLGSDPNTENGWGTSGYDSENLSTDGYSTDDASPAFIGEALDKLLDGATVVIRLEGKPASATALASFALLSADGNDALELDIDIDGGRTGKISSFSGSLNEQTDAVVNVGEGAINMLGFTIAPGRFDLAVNGSDAVTGTVTDEDRPTGNPPVAALIDPGNTNNFIQSITIYDPLPDTAGLSALSETDVTNTAPTFVDFDDWVNNEDGTYHIPTGDTGEGFLVNAAISEFIASSFADAEGNPLTLTIQSGDSRFQLDGDGPDIFCFNANEVVAPGAYSCILRATDSGGLYVEQEFTITVTS